jgi:hypothetical protein
MRLTRLIILAGCLYLPSPFLSSAQASSEMKQLIVQLQDTRTVVHSVYCDIRHLFPPEASE